MTHSFAACCQQIQIFSSGFLEDLKPLRSSKKKISELGVIRNFSPVNDCLSALKRVPTIRSDEG